MMSSTGVQYLSTSVMSFCRRLPHFIPLIQIFADSSQSIKLRLENERLGSEINRLKKLLENSEDGAIGGIYLSDSNSADAHSTDEKSRIERLEYELKKAKDQITSKNCTNPRRIMP